MTEAAADRIEHLLNDQLSGRQLPPTELTIIAKALLADMVPAPSKGEAKQ